MQKQFYLLLIMAMSAIGPSFGQNSNVEVTKEQRNNEVEFSSSSTESTPIVLRIDFFDLFNMQSETGSTAIATIYPNSRSRVCNLKTVVPSRPTSYKYSYIYNIGTSDVRLHEDQVYLLPIKPNSTASVGAVVSLNNIFPKIKSDTSFFGYSFNGEGVDTVYAARGGVVYGVKDGNPNYTEQELFKREDNRLTIFHKDGTMATYCRLKCSSIMVKNGEPVLAGQPIALAAKSTNRNFFNVVFHYYDRRKTTKEQIGYTYFAPKFIYADHSPDEIHPQNSYTAVHPVDVVTMEMSKKEKKRFMEQHGIGAEVQK